ncbi:hypothetical protein [Amycolatopsis sp. NPDC051102]|uniref:hypothetical protein n=1 Tax=Amycolatopsis sp. NPDC051102 TaxID=3155163 RepID=UPI003412F011
MIGLLDIDAAWRLAAERGQLSATGFKRAVAEPERTEWAEQRGRPGTIDLSGEEGQSRNLG